MDTQCGLLDTSQKKRAVKQSPEFGVAMESGGSRK